MNLSILYKKLTNRKYTIGYKFILSLFVGFVGVISFCNGYNIVLTFYDNIQGHFTIDDVPQSYSLNNTTDSNIYGLNFSVINGYCFTSKVEYVKFNGSTSTASVNGSGFDSFLWCQGRSQCSYVKKVSINALMTCDYWSDVNSFISGYVYINGQSSCPECPTCPTCNPQYTSDQCQSVYGLVSSGQLTTCENNYTNCQSDLNLCQSNTTGFNDLLNNCSNNLNACNNSLTSCLQQNCPETVTGTNRSSLFINNIQYPGAPTIKFTIPEEIERDQNTDEEETNIDVIGYGYDQDKMQQMVNTQYYKPTAEEMSGLMEKVADFLPLVAVALLIARIRRVIKKVF